MKIESIIESALRETTIEEVPNGEYIIKVVVEGDEDKSDVYASVESYAPLS